MTDKTLAEIKNAKYQLEQNINQQLSDFIINNDLSIFQVGLVYETAITTKNDIAPLVRIDVDLTL